MNDQSKPSTAELPTDQITEALLPQARTARINGQLIKGGRYEEPSAFDKFMSVALPIELFVVGLAIGVAFGRLIR